MIQHPIGVRRQTVLIVAFALCVLLSVPTLAGNLRQAVPRLMELGDIPGLSVAVISGDSVSWTGAFGLQNRSADTPVNQQTVFEAASLSKTSSCVWPTAAKSTSTRPWSPTRPIRAWLPIRATARSPPACA